MDVSVEIEMVISGGNQMLLMMHSPDLLYKFILGKRRLEEFHLISLFAEDIPARLVYVFQEQNFDILCSKWLQVLRIDDWAQASCESRATMARRSGLERSVR